MVSRMFSIWLCGFVSLVLFAGQVVGSPSIRTLDDGGSVLMHGSSMSAGSWLEADEDGQPWLSYQRTDEDGVVEISVGPSAQDLATELRWQLLPNIGSDSDGSLTISLLPQSSRCSALDPGIAEEVEKAMQSVWRAVEADVPAIAAEGISLFVDGDTSATLASGCGAAEHWSGLMACGFAATCASTGCVQAGHCSACVSAFASCGAYMNNCHAQMQY